MDIESHKRTLGILHIIYACILLLFFVFLGSIISILFPFIAEEVSKEAGKNVDEMFLLVSSIIKIVFILLMILSALPSFIAGIALLLKKSWGIALALVAGCVSIFSFPFGTAIGVYSIYVFVQNNKLKNDQNKG